MRLKDYIKSVIEASPNNTAITFEVNLYADTTVAESPTGNKVTFTVEKYEPVPQYGLAPKLTKKDFKSRLK